MDKQIAFFNGIDARTGNYYNSPMMLVDLPSMFSATLNDKKHVVFLRKFIEYLKKPRLGTIFGIDPANIDQSGWGVIFHHTESLLVRESMSGMIKYRNGKIFEYFDGETKDSWLRRHGISPGSVDPNRVPYYLLIVGEPSHIPFEFQYQLDVQYAVGRLNFDNPKDYEIYTQSVIEHETSENLFLPKNFVVIGTSHPGDCATETSVEYLAKPVVEKVQMQTGWDCLPFLKKDATKRNILDLLSKNQNYSLIFSACHGLGFQLGDKDQLRFQGAWICQDWPGKGAVRNEHVLSGEDIQNFQLSGKVFFNFSCFGAGTPCRDDFSVIRRQIAPYSFTASLPKKLLSSPNGSALAYIGHVDRAWGYSFLWDDIDAQPQTLISTLSRILTGTRIGHALSEINIRYAELSTMLLDTLYNHEYKKTVPDAILHQAQLWVACNDSRNYVLLGDPAVLLTK